MEQSNRFSKPLQGITFSEDKLSLKGKTVVITGGAQGIGATVALRMAQCGCELVLFDLQGEKVKATAAKIAEQTGQKVIGMQLDVTDPEQIKASLEEADRRMGKLDLLFNNAGIVLHKSFLELSKQEWDRVINVNLNGEFYMAQAFARYLISRGKKGAICNTASMSGHIVNWPQEQASYNTSKAGVIMMTKSLAVELAKYGIRVNCISPGYMYTELCTFVDESWQDRWMDLNPSGRYGTPEELVGAVMYLLSDAASYTSGADLVVDGMFTCV